MCTTAVSFIQERGSSNGWGFRHYMLLSSIARESIELERKVRRKRERGRDKSFKYKVNIADL